MPIIHKNKITVAAHRGDCYNYPENTMSAFVAAYEAGAEMIETDVHLTKDLIPVLIHDATLERTTNGKGRVEDYTLDELLALNAGVANFPEKIPLFEDFMNWVSPLPLTVNIEIKEYFDEGNVERAKLCIDKVLEIVEKLGIANSLKRRFARVDEIEKIWEPAPVRDPYPHNTGVFSMVKTKEETKKGGFTATLVGKVDGITFEKFKETTTLLFF